jgi:hypothetical protein
MKTEAETKAKAEAQAQAEKETEPGRGDLSAEQGGGEREPLLTPAELPEAPPAGPVPHLRNLSFETRGYRLRREGRPRTEKEPTVDRVPYVLDFGFLLADERAWKTAIRDQPRESAAIVRDVWERLTLPMPPAHAFGEFAPPEHVSWRRFFEACRIVARAPADGTSAVTQRGFDIDLRTLESMSCFFLELWGSEVRELRAWEFWTSRLQEPGSPGATRALENIEARTFPRWRDEPPGFGLPELSALYRRPLFRAWLLVASAWIPDPSDRVGFRLRPRPANAHAVASRHWYSTACPAANASTHMPMRMPGSCIVRGDWFCGIARGSRSRRLGERAIDLLCSRRANITRMQLGLGLPTRGFRDETKHWVPEFRSPLNTYDPSGRSRNLTLRDFEWLGAHPADEESETTSATPSTWLWRSRIMQYDRHSRIWAKWILYVYDSLLNGTSQSFRVFARPESCLLLYDRLKDWARSPQAAWPAAPEIQEFATAFSRFESLCRDLERALARATIRPISSVEGDDFH